MLKQLDESWQSYYKLKKTEGIKNPNPPGYKHTNFNIRFLNKGFKVSDGMLRLAIPKQQKDYIALKHSMVIDFLYINLPEKYVDFQGKAKVVEIIPLPKRNKYKVNIIIELPEVEYNKDEGVYMAVDLGINNLITCYISTGKTFIISGRQLLSINRYYDKKIAYYQSIAYSQQNSAGINRPRDTGRVQELYLKRRKQVNHLLHTATRKVINIAEQEGVSEIIIGDVAHIRDSKNIGRITQMLEYKAEDMGIKTHMQEESYTSQCSPYDEEVSEVTASKENRKKRGLYVVGGTAFNADCVGAYNIMKKYLCRIGRPYTAVVGLDTPMMYRFNLYNGFSSNQKLAISMSM